MTPTQRLPASLTPLDVAIAALLHRIAPVAPVELALPDALGCTAAGMPPLRPFPSRDVATADGWALRARDLVGASSYSPLLLSASPVWVEAGEPMPDNCDCVVNSNSVDRAGPLVQVLAEAAPGQGVRRTGGDIAGGAPAIAAGRRVRPRDLLIARAVGLDRLNVRRPRLRIVNIPAISGETVTAQLICEAARAEGAETVCCEAAGRDAASIAGALDPSACDLLVTIGGTGIGRCDALISALQKRGEVVAHGLALQPGRSCAIGRVEDVAVLALPGAPDQALGAWWTLALAALDFLSGRESRPRQSRPLARKIASHIGIAEIVLLERADESWMPLAVGDLSLAAIARSDGWLVVPGGSEGFAAGTPVDAYIMRD